MFYSFYYNNNNKHYFSNVRSHKLKLHIKFSDCKDSKMKNNDKAEKFIGHDDEATSMVKPQ